MEENKILHSLLQEAQLSDEHKPEVNNNEVFNMIEKYRNHVKQQKKNLSSSEKKHNASHPQHNRFGVMSDKIMDNTKCETSLMSHSQPCLYSVSRQHPKSSTNDVLHYAHLSDPREDINNMTPDHNENDSDIIRSNSSDNVISLKNKITLLRRQVQFLDKKTNKLKQLELAYSRIEQEFNQIIDQHEKHEQLERSAILQLEQQIQQLHQRNQILSKENETLNRILAQNRKSDIDQSPTEPAQEAPEFSSQLENDYNKEILYTKKRLDDVLSKNKELLIIDERHRIELDAQRTTLNEQRTHIDMLEKALTNAQERLSAKDRQAMDAIAVTEKCVHLQKLLQESLDEKQKHQEEYIKHKSQLEMDLAQLRVQLSKMEAPPFESRMGGNKPPENEEILKTIHAKDDRISLVENNLLSLQRRYDDELQRNNTKHNDFDVLRERVRCAEAESAEKDKRIESLLNEKQRIHGQWAEERRSLDHRVRVLEQDLRVLMTGSNGALHNGSENLNSGSQSYYVSSNLHNSGHHFSNIYRPPPLYHDTGLYASFNPAINYGGYFNPITSYSCSRSNSIGEESNHLRGSTSDMSTSGRSMLVHENTMTRMEELRRKIADRRASTASIASSTNNSENHQSGGSDHNVAVTILTPPPTVVNRRHSGITSVSIDVGNVTEELNNRL